MSTDEAIRLLLSDEPGDWQKVYLSLNYHEALCGFLGERTCTPGFPSLHFDPEVCKRMAADDQAITALAVEFNLTK